MPQQDLLNQQRIFAGYLIRREMRECGVWGPMPKLDGTPLEEHLVAAFPNSPEALQYSSYADIIQLIQAYGLPTYAGMSTRDAKALLYRFVTGRARAPAPSYATPLAAERIGGEMPPVPWNWIFLSFMGYAVFELLSEER